MENNSGNIIYLIVVIVAVLSSLLSKKKKAPVDSSPTPSTPHRSWQDVIREITMEQETQTVESPQPVTNNTVTRHGIDTKPFLDEEKKTHPETLFKKAPIVNYENVSVADEPNLISLPNFSNYDEVKRGIIFNEIFNRKF